MRRDFTCPSPKIDIIYLAKTKLKIHCVQRGGTLLYSISFYRNNLKLLYNVVSFSHHCGGILAFSSLRFFSWLRFVSVLSCTTLVRSCQGILIRLKSVFCLGHCDTLILFKSVLLICLCVWTYFPVAWPTFSPAVSVRHVASHFPREYFARTRSWSSQKLCSNQVL